MGGMWDKSASDERHPKFETGAEEAVIAWSAPHAWHPEAKEFVNSALNHCFKGEAWNFTHTDARFRGRVCKPSKPPASQAILHIFLQKSRAVTEDARSEVSRCNGTQIGVQSENLWPGVWGRARAGCGAEPREAIFHYDGPLTTRVTVMGSSNMESSKS